MIDPFLINLSRVLAHSMVFEARRGAAGDPVNILGTEFITEQPKVPKFTPINAGIEAGKAIRGNIARFGDIAKLGSEVNAFNQAELEKMLESALPGYKSMVGSISNRVGGLLSGEVPKDVSESIGRNAAWQSMAGGYGGSGMGRNLVARDLGLTSLNLIEKGIDAGSRWLATARGAMTANQFDATSMFLTPEQQVQTKMFNTAGQFQRDWMKNQLDAEFSLGNRINADVNSSLQGWNQTMQTMSSL